MMMRKEKKGKKKNTRRPPWNGHFSAPHLECSFGLLPPVLSLIHLRAQTIWGYAAFLPSPSDLSLSSTFDFTAPKMHSRMLEYDIQLPPCVLMA